MLWPLSKRKWETVVTTIDKRNGRKVFPVNIPLQGGCINGGDISNLIGNGEFKPTVVRQESHLTPGYYHKALSSAEKQLFIDVLFEFERLIAFDDFESKSLPNFSTSSHGLINCRCT